MIIIIIIIIYLIILFIFHLLIYLIILKNTKGKRLLISEVVFYRLEKHCGSETTSAPIIAATQWRHRQPSRQRTMSRSGPRSFRVQKQVLRLYRGFLRVTRPKSPEDRWRIESFVSVEFCHNSKLVDRKNFLYIEYLLRRGKLTGKMRT